MLFRRSAWPNPQRMVDGTIARNLEWGPRSSTWLALDNNASDLSYGAIKIFTTMAREDSMGNNEHSFFLGPLKNVIRSTPKMESYFYEHDTKGKRHLCLVFHVLGPSVKDLRLTNVESMCAILRWENFSKSESSKFLTLPTLFLTALSKAMTLLCTLG